MAFFPSSISLRLVLPIEIRNVLLTRNSTLTDEFSLGGYRRAKKKQKYDRRLFFSLVLSTDHSTRKDHRCVFSTRNKAYVSYQRKRGGIWTNANVDGPFPFGVVNDFRELLRAVTTRQKSLMRDPLLPLETVD